MKYQRPIFFLQKKTQFSLFVIAGFVLVLGLAILLLSLNQTQTSSLRNSQYAIFTPGQSAVSSYMDECIKQGYRAAKDRFGLSADSKTEFEKIMKDSIIKCSLELKAQYESQGFAVVQGDLFLTADIMNDSVAIDIQCPQTFTKATTKFEFTTYSRTYPRQVFENIPGGKTAKETIITTQDEKATLMIPKDTMITDSRGNPVERITIKELDRHEGANGEYMSNSYVAGTTYFQITGGEGDHIVFSNPVTVQMQTKEEDFLTGEIALESQVGEWFDEYKTWILMPTTTRQLPNGDYIHTASVTYACPISVSNAVPAQTELSITDLGNPASLASTGGGGLPSDEYQTAFELNRYILNSYEETDPNLYFNSDNPLHIPIPKDANVGWDCTITPRPGSGFLGPMTVSTKMEITSALKKTRRDTFYKGPDGCKYTVPYTAVCTPKGMKCCCSGTTGNWMPTADTCPSGTEIKSGCCADSIVVPAPEKEYPEAEGYAFSPTIDGPAINDKIETMKCAGGESIYNGFTYFLTAKGDNVIRSMSVNQRPDLVVETEGEITYPTEPMDSAKPKKYLPVSIAFFTCSEDKSTPSKLCTGSAYLGPLTQDPEDKQYKTYLIVEKISIQKELAKPEHQNFKAEASDLHFIIGGNLDIRCTAKCKGLLKVYDTLVQASAKTKIKGYNGRSCIAGRFNMITGSTAQVGDTVAVQESGKNPVCYQCNTNGWDEKPMDTCPEAKLPEDPNNNWQKCNDKKACGKESIPVECIYYQEDNQKDEPKDAQENYLNNRIIAKKDDSCKVYICNKVNDNYLWESISKASCDNPPNS